MLAHELEVVDDDHNRPVLAVPALDQRHEVGEGPRIDRIERFVEQDDLGVLDQHPREQRPLQLAARQRIDRARLETFQPYRHQRLLHRLPVLGGVAAEQPAPRPQPHRDEVDDASGKAAVEFRLLRQIGDLSAGHLQAFAGHWLEHADDALHQGRLARAVGADHRGQRAGLHPPVEVMNRRVIIVAERQVAECQAGFGHELRRSPLSRPFGYVMLLH